MSLHVVERQTLLVELVESVNGLCNVGLVLDYLLEVVNGKVSLEEVVGFVSVQNDEHGEFTVGDDPVAHFVLKVSAVNSADADVSQWVSQAFPLVHLLNINVLVIKTLVVLVQVAASWNVAFRVVQVQEPGLIVHYCALVAWHDVAFEVGLGDETFSKLTGLVWASEFVESSLLEVICGSFSYIAVC